MNAVLAAHFHTYYTNYFSCSKLYQMMSMLHLVDKETFATDVYILGHRGNVNRPHLCCVITGGFFSTKRLQGERGYWFHLLTIQPNIVLRCPGPLEKMVRCWFHVRNAKVSISENQMYQNTNEDFYLTLGAVDK